MFDAGAFFRVEQLPDGTRRVVCTAPEGLPAESDVFLVRFERPTCDASRQP